MTAILGYARVSTLGQDLDAQLAALTAQGVESGQIFTDKLSGAVNTVRPGLAALLHYAREGDTVVVTAIDRLGRSVAEVTRTKPPTSTATVPPTNAAGTNSPASATSPSVTATADETSTTTTAWTSDPKTTAS